VLALSSSIMSLGRPQPGACHSPSRQAMTAASTPPTDQQRSVRASADSRFDRISNLCAFLQRHCDRILAPTRETPFTSRTQPLLGATARSEIGITKHRVERADRSFLGGKVRSGSSVGRSRVCHFRTFHTRHVPSPSSTSIEGALRPSSAHASLTVKIVAMRIPRGYIDDERAVFSRRVYYDTTFVDDGEREERETSYAHRSPFPSPFSRFPGLPGKLSISTDVPATASAERAIRSGFSLSLSLSRARDEVSFPGRPDASDERR